MAISDAKKQAMAKYRKNKVKQVSLSLFPTDQDIIDYLDFIKSEGGQVSGFIKKLIRDDLSTKMEKDPGFKFSYENYKHNHS